MISKAKISYCKHRQQQVNQGIWWCDCQFDKDFMKSLTPLEQMNIMECDCGRCPFKDEVEIYYDSETSISWEKVSEI